MLPGKRADNVSQIADTVAKTEAALGELHQYYRFGRHQSPFPQKLYFLFSHCAQLLFSLWLQEQDGPHKVFTGSPHLAAMFDRVDFGALRYADYSRRMLYANAYEEHLKNEPKWFKFWVQLLQGLQGADVAGAEMFTRQFFASLTDGKVLEGRFGRRDQKSLAALVQGSRAGRLLLHSMWVLEDVISTGSACIAGHDSTAHGIEQMQSLICLLHQLRRAIVWETMARGPHTLSAGDGWYVTSSLDRFLDRRIGGVLTVTLAQGDGSVTCKHEGVVDSRTRERAWVRGIAALPCAYEELLFRTWPLDAREPPSDCHPPALGEARWIVQAVEAGHLEAVSKHVDKLLEALEECPAYASLVEMVTRVLRNGRDEWTCTELPWDCVRSFDQLIGKLKFACREAKVLGGMHAAEKVVANLWPPSATTPRETDITVEDAAQTEEETTGVCEASTDERRDMSQTCSVSVQAKPPEPADGPPPAAPAPESQPDEVELADIESLLQPESCKTRPPVEQIPVPPEESGAMPELDKLERVISLLVNGDDSPSESIPAADAGQSLLWRLLEWHQPPAEGVERDPLSLVRLQQDLGWSQSQVLQEMDLLFGRKPFTLYRQKCLDESIRSFLETCHIHRGRRTRTDAHASSPSVR
jgi:hypothetical protein